MPSKTMLFTPETKVDTVVTPEGLGLEVGPGGQQIKFDEEGRLVDQTGKPVNIPQRQKKPMPEWAKEYEAQPAVPTQIREPEMPRLSPDVQRRLDRTRRIRRMRAWVQKNCKFANT